MLYLHRGGERFVYLKCHIAAVNLNTMTSKDVISTLGSINQLIYSSKRLLYLNKNFILLQPVIQTYYYHRLSINFYNVFETPTLFTFKKKRYSALGNIE